MKLLFWWYILTAILAYTLNWHVSLFMWLLPVEGYLLGSVTGLILGSW